MVITGQKDAFTSNLKRKRLCVTECELSQAAPVPDQCEGPRRAKQGSGTLTRAGLLTVLVLEHSQTTVLASIVYYPMLNI